MYRLIAAILCLIIVVVARGQDQEIPWEEGYLQLKWSPDGNFLAFIQPESFHLVLGNADFTNLQRITPEDVTAWDFEWSPDSNMIAVVLEYSYIEVLDFAGNVLFESPLYTNTVNENVLIHTWETNSSGIVYSVQQSRYCEESGWHTVYLWEFDNDIDILASEEIDDRRYGMCKSSFIASAWNREMNRIFVDDHYMIDNTGRIVYTYPLGTCSIHTQLLIAACVYNVYGGPFYVYSLTEDWVIKEEIHQIPFFITREYRLMTPVFSRDGSRAFSEVARSCCGGGESYIYLFDISNEKADRYPFVPDRAVWHPDNNHLLLDYFGGGIFFIDMEGNPLSLSEFLNH